MPKTGGGNGIQTHCDDATITDLKSVAVRVTSNHQPLYVPQSRLECTNAFQQTAGDANPFVDDIVDGISYLPSGIPISLLGLINQIKRTMNGIINQDRRPNNNHQPLLLMS